MPGGNSCGSFRCDPFIKNLIGEYTHADVGKNSETRFRHDRIIFSTLTGFRLVCNPYRTERE